MFKLLKVVVTGYKLLKDDFVIDFLSKARVYDEDKEKEVLEIDDGLYAFRTLAVVGGNSSGKSTILSLRGSACSSTCSRARFTVPW